MYGINTNSKIRNITVKEDNMQKKEKIYKYFLKYKFRVFF
mgnify:CR=1 FL=1